MRIARFGVLVGLLFAQLGVYCVGLSVSIGHSLTLPCHGDPSRDVEWWFRQSDYPDWLPVAELYKGSFSPSTGFDGRVVSFHRTKPGNYSLVLSPVVYSDLGIYKCQYKDKTYLSDLKLQIIVSSYVAVLMGMSASLPCFGKMNRRAHAGDLDILWKRGGEKVYQLHKNTVTYGPRFENRTSLSTEQALYGNMSLTIRWTRFSDEGDYQCFYNSPKESGNPDSASVVVTGHPPQTLTVKAGGLLSIPLYTADSVGLTFSDEVLMLYENNGSARYGERCAQRCEFLAQNYTFLLRGVTLEDAGVYNVTDSETNKTISSLQVSVDPDGDPGPQTNISAHPKGYPFPTPSGSPPSTGLSAGAVTGIVVGVVQGVLLLVLGSFAVWKCYKKRTGPMAVFSYQVTSAEDQDDSAT